MSTKQEELGHGNSPAAWTAVIVMMLGITVGALFLFLDNTVMVWVGAGLLVLGMILGGVLKAAGYGVGGPKYQPKQHG